MALRQCPLANEACRYFDRAPVVPGAENGCKSDLDHIVPQRLAIDGLSKLFIHSPENQQQLCRVEHETKTKAGDEPLPERDVMLASVKRQIKDGSLQVSRQTKRKLMKGKI